MRNASQLQNFGFIVVGYFQEKSIWPWECIWRTTVKPPSALILECLHSTVLSSGFVGTHLEFFCLFTFGWNPLCRWIESAECKSLISIGHAWNRMWSGGREREDHTQQQQKTNPRYRSLCTEVLALKHKSKIFRQSSNAVQHADIGLPTGNGMRLSCSQAQLGQATGLAVA